MSSPIHVHTRAELDALFLARRNKYPHLSDLWIAVWCRHIHYVHDAISRNNSIEQRGSPFGDDNKTPLHIAVENDSADIVEILLRHKAVVSTTDAKGRTPLHTAILHCKDENLLAYQRICGIPCQTQESVDEYYRVCLLLLQYGADENALTTSGQTPLHLAAGMKLTEIASLLLLYKSDVSATDADGCTPLMYHLKLGYRGLMCVDRNTDMIRLLLLHGAKLQDSDDRGMTALHWAVDSDSCEKIRFLILAGADEDAMNNEGLTAETYAISTNAGLMQDTIQNACLDRDRVLAFSMGRHHHLGYDSVVNSLYPDDVMRMIADYARRGSG